jgi:hypothetical protein
MFVIANAGVETLLDNIDQGRLHDDLEFNLGYRVRNGVTIGASTKSTAGVQLIAAMKASHIRVHQLP